MRSAFIIIALSLSIGALQAQEIPSVAQPPAINRNNLVIRPNSRDYIIVRNGNNHQRMIQIRMEVMIRQRQAIINRRMAMERRRMQIQQRMIRQQQIRQRMIRQRGTRN